MKIFKSQSEKKNNKIASSCTNTGTTDIIEGDSFKKLFDHHPDAIFTLNEKGEVIDYNHSVSQILGYEKKKF